MDLTGTLGKFRLVALLEGISYLLFAVTMPIKYMMDIPGPNKVVGMIHGLLFVIYVVLALMVCLEKEWGMKRFIIFFIASLVPFGTFWVDAKYLKGEQA